MPVFRPEIVTEKGAIHLCRTFCRAKVSMLGKTCRVGQEKTAGDLSTDGRHCFCFCVSSHLPNFQGSDPKDEERDVSRPSLFASDGLLEQTVDDLRRLVGNRQSLHTKLLLCLQSLELGALFRHVRIDKIADTCLQRISKFRREFMMDRE